MTGPESVPPTRPETPSSNGGEGGGDSAPWWVGLLILAGFALAYVIGSLIEPYL